MKPLLLFSLMILFLACGNSNGLLSEKVLERANYQEVRGFFDPTADAEKEPDKMPMYPNGLQGLMTDVSNEINYPEFERRNNIEGKVVVSYIIDENGRVRDIKIDEGVSQGLNKEAIRVTRSLKRWYPAFKDGQPVKVHFKQPFQFGLTD